MVKRRLQEGGERVPEQMPEVYEGDRPYIFMNYAHADRFVVLPIIRALANAGYRVWYDDGIRGGAEFPEYIADRIHDCACFVMFISRASLASYWCTHEVRYALDLRKLVLPIYLEDVELTRGLSMSISHTQVIFWHKLEADEFYRRLFESHVLEKCLSDERSYRWCAKPPKSVTRPSMPMPRSKSPKDETHAAPSRSSWPHGETEGYPRVASRRIEESWEASSSSNARRVLLDAFPALRSLFVGKQSVDVPGVEQREAFNNYSLVELKERFKAMLQQR